MSGLRERRIEESGIKSQLRKSWFAFFGRYRRLYPVQRSSIPWVLRGDSLVVCSPAATGKTEAVMAPVAERMLQNGWPGLSVLWISPTRALVNDLYSRLKPPLTSLGIALSRRTGDRPQYGPQKPSSVLITTPESLDSLISRHPRLFATVKVVALDELHLLDGGPRGDQLRVLVSRLKLITPEMPSFYALSATIADPWELGRRYFPRFRVVLVSAPREIESRFYPFNEAVFDQLLESFRRTGLHKVLTFCNTRHDAEVVAEGFNKPPFRERVWVHHASLSRAERESAEWKLNNSRSGICVATSTLELGVDIGDIDAVVLWGAPPDANAFLQRLGRGNRQRKDLMLAYCIYKGEVERVLFSILLQDARSGELRTLPYAPTLSVVCQQIFSYLHQKRRVRTTFDSIKRILEPILSDEGAIRCILGNLLERGWVVQQPCETFSSSEKLGNLVRAGRIHSNIEGTDRRFQVIDVQTGKKVGSVERSARMFSLAGKTWERAEERGGKIYASRSAGIARGDWIFKGRSRSLWDYRTGMRIKSSLFPGLEPFEFPYVVKTTKVYLLHFAGELYGWLWGEALKARGVRLFWTDAVWWGVEGSFKSADLVLDQETVMRLLEGNVERIRNLVDLGSFFHLLPREMRLRSAYEAIHSSYFIDYTRLARFREVESLPGGLTPWKTPRRETEEER